MVEEIRAAGGQALANGASVSDWEAVQAMVEWSKKRRVRATHLLRYLVVKNSKMPEGWGDLLRDFERCVALAGKKTAKETSQPHGPAPA